MRTTLSLLVAALAGLLAVLATADDGPSAVNRTKATRPDVLVLDLEGFTGVWDGALSTSGVALLLEVLAAVHAAHRAGATCWLIDRGPRRSEIGALLLRRQSTLMPVQPGTPRPAGHHTEDAGDAPTEIADLLRDMEETSRA